MSKFKIDDEVCIIHKQFIFLDYIKEENLFICSGDITDRLRSGHLEAIPGPASLRIARFNLPGTFCNLTIKPHYDFYIDEADIYGYHGRVYENDHLLCRGADGNRYNIKEDVYFEENGVYYLYPVNHGGKIIEKIAGRRLINMQPGHKLKGDLWDGEDIKGTIDRMFTFNYSYETYDRGSISSRVITEYERHDELDFRDHPHKIAVAVVTTDQFEQWDIPLRHLKKIN